MGFGIHFDMEIYQKLLVVTIVALRSCPSFELVVDQYANQEFVRPPNLHKPRTPVETEKKGNAI